MTMLEKSIGKKIKKLPVIYSDLKDWEK